MGLVFNDTTFASVTDPNNPDDRVVDVLTNVNYSDVIGASAAYKRYTNTDNDPSGTFNLIGH